MPTVAEPTKPWSQVFSEAADLIVDPANWCQDAFARKADGTRLRSPLDAEAAKFCGSGALEFVAASDNRDARAIFAAYHEWSEWTKDKYHRSPIAINDDMDAPAPVVAHDLIVAALRDFALLADELIL